MLYISPQQSKLSELAKNAIIYGYTNQFIEASHQGLHIHDGHDTYFTLAAQYGRCDIFAFLLTQGYDINHRYHVALDIAIKYNQINFVHFFIEISSKKDPVKIEPYLSYAIENNLVDITKYFLEIEIQFTRNHITKAIFSQRLTILELFLDNLHQLDKNDPDAVIFDDLSPYKHADGIDYWHTVANLLNKNSLGVVQLLIEKEKLNFTHINEYHLQSDLDIKSHEVKDYLLSYYHSFKLKNHLTDVLNSSHEAFNYSNSKV